MKAAVFIRPGEHPFSITTVPDPSPGARDVIIKIGRCGICGSDVETVSGVDMKFPIGSVLGHEFAGEVVTLGNAVQTLKVGDRIMAMPIFGCGHCIHCLSGSPIWCANMRIFSSGAFAEYMAVPESGSVKLPDHLSDEEGALVEPLSVALHAVTLARLAVGSRIVVAGAGPIGLATMFWARRLGAGSIVAIATSERRKKLALAMGAAAFVQTGEHCAEAINDMLGGQPDLVFECAGKAGTLFEAMQYVRPGGAVVSLGASGKQDSFVPIVALAKELRVQFSFAYGLSDCQHTVRVLASGAPELKTMITKTISLDELPAAFLELSGRSGQCKVMVAPGGMI
jgi:threonine dehydrogenase-like Zn-dependent dehydrogenase